MSPLILFKQTPKTNYNIFFKKSDAWLKYLFFIAQYRDLSHDIHALIEIWLHREYNLEMENKSRRYTMLHWSIVTHA